MITVSDHAPVNIINVAGLNLFWQRGRLGKTPTYVVWLKGPTYTTHARTLWEAIYGLLNRLGISMSSEEKTLLKAKH